MLVAYNAAIWPALFVAYAFGLLTVVALWFDGSRGKGLACPP